MKINVVKEPICNTKYDRKKNKHEPHRQQMRATIQYQGKVRKVNENNSTIYKVNEDGKTYNSALHYSTS